MIYLKIRFRKVLSNTKMNPNFERLGKSVIPLNYDLEIAPDLKSFTFKGKVVIEVKVI